MTFYLDLPGLTGKLDRLISDFGDEVLPGPPRGLDAAGRDKALVCVGDEGRYEAAAYIMTEQEFNSWTGSAGIGPKTWLLMDRQVADGLCPGAAEYRRRWQTSTAREAEAAAHPDNLLPVARASRSGLRRDAGLLREYAAALRGEELRMRPDGWPAPTSAGPQRRAAGDLDAIAKDLEIWAERDWIAVIDIGPDREHLAGPLPPFRGEGKLA